MFENSWERHPAFIFKENLVMIPIHMLTENPEFHGARDFIGWFKISVKIVEGASEATLYEDITF